MEANNMAAMREALAGLMDGICFHCDLSEDCKGTPCEKMQKAKAALAKPPRNCDRFDTVKDAAIAFARERQDAPQPCPDFTFSAWLLAPATEQKGETDEQK